MTGRSGATSRAAASAASASPRSLSVSTSTRSIPPSTSAAICSANSAWASSARQGPERRQQLAGRTEVAGDEQPALVGHRPGEPGPRSRFDLGQPVAEAVHVQPRPGAAEGVGGQHPRPRVGVRRVRRPDRVGVLEVPELTGGAVLEAAVLQQGAHPAVEQHRPTRAQQGGEPVHVAQPVEVAVDPLGRPLRVQLRRRPGRAPRPAYPPPRSTASGPSPGGSRRPRCRRAASPPRRSPPGTAARARPSPSRRRPAPPPSREARATGSPGTPSTSGA